MPASAECAGSILPDLWARWAESIVLRESIPFMMRLTPVGPFDRIEIYLINSRSLGDIAKT
jgi:hypothetical protein